MIDQAIFKDKKAVYYTLGCKLNFAETSTIGKLLAGLGVRKARPGEQADICVINTCSVTELADKKGRQAIRRIGKRHPGAFIVATGCYAQLKPEEVSLVEGVDLVLGAEQKLWLPRYIERWEKRPGAGTIFCSYCTIPFARGRSRNGSIAEMVEQAREVARQGGKEIVLTGVNIGDFGKSTNETFIDLIRALDEVEGIVRYRISSIEPNLITDEAIDFVANSRRFAPHFHIPLQSGSDAVLKLMRRRYDTALFRHKIEKIKALMPHAFIGVDVIVGTRGETDVYFEETRQFIESLDISQLHVFSYSERPGTQALKIDYVVDPQVKHTRSQCLLELSDRKLHDFYEAHIGQKANVLFEQTRKGGKMHGFTENYIKVEIPYDTALVNETRIVALTGWNNDRTALTADLLIP